MTLHMADALLSPLVGGVMTVAGLTPVGFAVKRMTGDRLDDKKIPMMGVMGAFVFAAQMINFTIPGTGSSGHLGGGILLAALLGPFPALLTMACVLLIQCLMFADGGLLAYGCNVFNIGVCACLLAYPLLYKPIIRRGMNKRRIMLASVASAVVGLQIGAFGVVVQTAASGVTGLPFGVFAAFMQPIHLAIGVVEGLVTGAVLCFVFSARPELLDGYEQKADAPARLPVKRITVMVLALALLIGGGLSIYASTAPDGLEWALERAAHSAGLEQADEDAAAPVTAILPDYAFAGDESGSPLGTATAGIVGGLVTVAAAGGTGLIIRGVRKVKREKAARNKE